jgi:hypothetical protein
MQCLVCTGAATDITLAGFEGIVVRCPNCGDYEVADSALRRFKPRLYQNAVRPSERPRALKPQDGRRSPPPASNSN